MPNLLKTIILDDEKKSRENLAQLLINYCPEVEIIGKAGNTVEAKCLIESLGPDLVFLDIEMPDQNGFEFLQSLGNIQFKTIIVTAYDHYGIQAVKHQAFDYLLKPLIIKELEEAVRGILAWKNNLPQRFEKENFELYRSYFQPKKISLPDTSGFMLIEPDDLIRLQANNVYSIAYFRHTKKQVFSKSIKFFEEMLLKDIRFMRIHKSHLINLKHVNSFIKSVPAKVHMSDGSELPVSKRKFVEFFDRIQNYAHLA